MVEEYKLNQMFKMQPDFDEYFTLKSIIGLGVTVNMKDIDAEKLLLFCHIKELTNGK